MKSVYMLMHQHKSDTVALAAEITEAFTKAGISVAAETWLCKKIGEGASSLFQPLDPAECDAIVAVGGDGTLLRANRLALKHDLPLLGINIGRVGFLTEVELDQLDEACEMLARDAYDIEERMLLEAYVGDHRAFALNDIVVSRGGYSRLIGMNVCVNGELAGHYVADGLIISTPTGSTGYSLSAGGPLVYPEVECMLITPICAHSLQHRPIVTSASQTITVFLTEERSAMLSADGQEPVAFDGGNLLTITRAERPARLIRLNPSRFFSKIRIKLTEWSR